MITVYEYDEQNHCTGRTLTIEKNAELPKNMTSIKPPTGVLEPITWHEDLNLWLGTTQEEHDLAFPDEKNELTDSQKVVQLTKQVDDLNSQLTESNNKVDLANQGIAELSSMLFSMQTPDNGGTE